MHSLKLKKKQEKTKEYNQRSAIYSQGSVVLPPGFANKENSCYANSILQCIINIRALRDLCERVASANHVVYIQKNASAEKKVVA